MATLDPDGGGRLTRLAVGGFDLLTSDGSFVMAPSAGRTGNGRFTFEGVEYRLPVPEQHAPHAIHGTVRDRPWGVEAAGDREVRLSTDLGPDWPWEGRCEQVVSLDEDAITLELSVHSAGDSFPAVIGWHPWFTNPADVELHAGSMLERGDDHLPTGRHVDPPRIGERPLDDCFVDVTWPVVLRWDGLSLSVRATGCRYVVFYDEPAHATCVEPQTGPPNGLNTGDFTLVTRGSPLVASTRWSWRPA